MYLSDLTICFLDIDGVLNGEGSKNEKDFLPEAIKVLNILNKKYDIKIVLCSSWRGSYPFKYIENLFKEKGILAELYDVTPWYVGEEKLVSFSMSEMEYMKQCSPDKGRNAEILKYIRLHGIKRFVILDDYYYSCKALNRHAIQTEAWGKNSGLRLSHLKRIEEILSMNEFI